MNIYIFLIIIILIISLVFLFSNPSTPIELKDPLMVTLSLIFYHSILFGATTTLVFLFLSLTIAPIDSRIWACPLILCDSLESSTSLVFLLILHQLVWSHLLPMALTFSSVCDLVSLSITIPSY